MKNKKLKKSNKNKTLILYGPSYGGWGSLSTGYRQKFLVLIWSNSEGGKAESTLELPSGLEPWTTAECSKKKSRKRKSIPRETLEKVFLLQTLLYIKGLIHFIQ